jgi:hypothetical protein
MPSDCTAPKRTFGVDGVLWAFERELAISEIA